MSNRFISVEEAVTLPNLKMAIAGPLPTIIILRGISGSGKSTVARKIQELYGSQVVICSADKYFATPEGEYQFDASRLSEVHMLCRQSVFQALEDKSQKRVVVIDNTHSTFLEYAEYTFKHVPTFILEFACRPHEVNICASRTTHRVPLAVLQRMYNRWQYDRNAILMSVCV
jgi:hypothetical protein